MSLEAFQRIVADLVASPLRCIELRQDASLLDGHELSARERRRVLAMVQHAGMSHNCTLYRANRLTPIARSLPGTCVRLGARLVHELEAFWAAALDSELQFKREAERFAQFLLPRLRAGSASDALIADELLTELQALELNFSEIRTQ
jgi:hypothetical protein